MVYSGETQQQQGAQRLYGMCPYTSQLYDAPDPILLWMKLNKQTCFLVLFFGEKQAVKSSTPLDFEVLGFGSLLTFLR